MAFRKVAQREADDQHSGSALSTKSITAGVARCSGGSRRGRRETRPQGCVALRHSLSHINSGIINNEIISCEKRNPCHRRSSPSALRRGRDSIRRSQPLAALPIARLGEAEARRASLVEEATAVRSRAKFSWLQAVEKSRNGERISAEAGREIRHPHRNPSPSRARGVSTGTVRRLPPRTGRGRPPRRSGRARGRRRDRRGAMRTSRSARRAAP